MLRVAKRAVFLSDSNRFGQGSLPARLLKLALYKIGLWGAFNYLSTFGKGYQVTEATECPTHTAFTIPRIRFRAGQTGLFSFPRIKRAEKLAASTAEQQWDHSLCDSR
jgi:hypothetical protein